VKPKHILVIRLSAMGDVAMSVPVLKAFIEQNPSVKITVLSRGFFKPMFDNLTNVNFYEADVNGKHKGFLGLFKLYTEIKQLKIDAIADIHNVLRSKLLRFFFLPSQIKISVIDKGRAEKKSLTRNINKVFKQLKTTHQRYAAVFRHLGFKADIAKPSFPNKPDLSSELLKIISLDHFKWIGIAPFAQYQSKMYPLDLIEEVISKLVSLNQFKIFLFGGGAKEIKILDSLAAKFENVISVAGKLNLSDEIILISNLDCMVSMDSANSHLASMQGVKTITLWGITHPFAGFAPFNQPKEHMLLPDLDKYPNIPCSVYGNKVCVGYENVMRSILPNKVVEKIISTI
jgi:ADP-heptose:LPS heptosyltransferase